MNRTKKFHWPYKDAAPYGKIGYIREDIPQVPLKPYTGKTYQDTMPDTFDG